MAAVRATDGRCECRRMVDDVQLRASSSEDDHLRKKHLGCSINADPMASAAQTCSLWFISTVDDRVYTNKKVSSDVRPFENSPLQYATKPMDDRQVRGDFKDRNKTRLLHSADATEMFLFEVAAVQRNISVASAECGSLFYFGL